MPEDMEDHEVNVYGDEARSTLMSDDEISPEEEAFMKGYDEAEEADEEEEDTDYEDAFEK
ncbi:hypothetical protein GOV10_04645 [Candidatus Woesearchaeota archaeon]|nr:hypothetical protein [Candidatus Woesearchaeota archaeon]